MIIINISTSWIRTTQYLNVRTSIKYDPVEVSASRTGHRYVRARLLNHVKLSGYKRAKMVPHDQCDQIKIAKCL